jgi:mono/diheme cytochrome c family protein
MPYFVFHNMSAGDADAVVAYLRSIPAVDNPVPERQPLGFPFTMAAHPIPETSIPHTTLAPTDPYYASAERGRYLAGMAGVCIRCHTAPAPGPVPVKLDSLFAGDAVSAPAISACRRRRSRRRSGPRTSRLTRRASRTTRPSRSGRCC